MKQVDALVYTAKHNNGRVRIAEAKKLFTKDGVMKVPKTHMAYELLHDEATIEDNAQALLMRTRSAS
jgi:exopolysaccharide biosynthesis protein